VVSVQVDDPGEGRLTTDLVRWARAVVGAGAEVDAVRPMPGNAGRSYGFDVRPARGGTVRRFVIRLAPVGVGRRGNTDVLRQVPLLEALSRTSVPVAPVRWWTDDPSWFGTDVFVQDRLDARPLHLSDPAQSVQAGDGDVLPYLEQAVDALAAIHAVSWRQDLRGWSDVRAASEEIDFWAGLADRSGRPDWIRLQGRLSDLLRAHQPRDHRIGLVHGDYQTNNLLFDDDGGLRAVIDWELSGIGPIGLDLGWLIVMTDPSCWSEDHRRRLRVRAEPAWIVERYESAAHHTASAVGWYRALACHRFAAISAFNLRLHETGKRIDPFWELMATSIPALLRRGTELAETSSDTVTPHPERRSR
jgi:aminoglycoside phosphotransferase (APT) family kinase protein